MNRRRLAPRVSFRTADSSGDVVLESDGADASQALLDLARGFSHLATAGSSLSASQEQAIDLKGRDPASLVVAFINELVFLLETEGFLPMDGTLVLEGPSAAPHLRGRLKGDTFDASRHRRGLDVKAATYHGLVFEAPTNGSARIRVLLDL
jgi:SHS2 domain-containing protein